MSDNIPFQLWRGKKLVDIVLKPDRAHSSSENVVTQSSHELASYKFNQNPDPSFKISTFNTSCQDNIQLQSPDRNKTASDYHNKITSSTSRGPEPGLSENDLISLSHGPEPSRLENDLITLVDLGIHTNREQYIFVTSPTPDNNDIQSKENLDIGEVKNPSERSRYTFRSKNSKERSNFNLQRIAFDYASDNSEISRTDSVEDFSATDGSDYIPSNDNDSDKTEHSVKDPHEDLLSTPQNQQIRSGSLSDLEEPSYQPLPDLLSLLDDSIGNESPNLSPSLLPQLSHAEITDEDLRDTHHDESAMTGRPSRGRKRKCPQSREERKRARNQNKEYFDYKRRCVRPKLFIDYKCKCKKSCQNVVPLETRKRFFNKYWSLGEYNAQTSFLGVFVKETKTSVDTKRKNFNRKYKIEDYDVCRDMFCQTVRICSTRISTAMQKLHSRKPLLDQRGFKQGGMNRTHEERQQEIREFIDSIPLYSSHYSRETTSAKFFKPGVTLSMVYDQYKEAISTRDAVSFGYFKQFFYSNYNIKVKILSKDTCNMCDSLRIQLINASRQNESTENIKETKKSHLDRAEHARSTMKSDMLSAKENEDIECLSFDMEKTLPLPRLQTNIIFYKRQLWLYNLGVHSAKHSQSYCYTWLEGQAGRGAQEVGSCLIKHIMNHVGENVKHLLLWSDSCGGQNRNIKITLLMKALLQMKPTLESITFKYLIPGHSYLPNDKDFGDIERALKFNQRIYTPKEYIDIIRICKKKNPIIVSEMTPEEFYSSEQLEKHIVNRKKTTTKNKINWLKARQIKITRDNMFNIYMKYDFNINNDFECINILRKPTTGRRNILTRLCQNNTAINDSNNEEFSFRGSLSMLWPNGKAIAEPKLKDIQSLMHLIPSDAQHFYMSLIGSVEERDDVDGFNTNLDYELLEEEEQVD